MLIKTVILNFALFSAPFLGLSQKKTRTGIIEKNHRDIISSVEFSPNDKKPQSEKEFFRTYLSTGANDQFVKVAHNSKRENFVHDHFDQYYNGVKVDGAGYNFHYKNGEVYFANGHYVDVGNLDATPGISQEKAVEKFLNHKRIGKENVMESKAELLVKELITSNNLVSTELVYRVVLQANHPDNNEIGYVSARTGEVVMTEPRTKKRNRNILYPLQWSAAGQHRICWK